MASSPADIDKLFLKDDKPVESSGYVCTVVSLLPFEIFETKPHLTPNAFRIPAAEDGKLGILHVGEGHFAIPNPFDERNYDQLTPPREMARSIVDDYRSAHIALEADAQPGIFWVEGRQDDASVKELFKDQIHKAKVQQDNWFRRLIAMADADWQRNHNMLAVSDLQRHAARALGVKKDWVDFVAIESTKCKFCQFDTPIGAIICPNCKEVLDINAYKAMKGSN